MATTFRTMSTDAILKMATSLTRSEADVRRTVAHFKAADTRADFERALWIHARKNDGIKGKDLAEELNVTAGRVSQIHAPLVAGLDAGIPFPTSETFSAWGSLITHVSRVYKSSKAGRDSIAHAVESARALDDAAAKFAVFAALEPIKASRAARPNDNLASTEADPANNGAPTTGATITERPSTWSERLAALVADAATAPIEDIALVQRLVTDLSDAIDARTPVTEDAPALLV